MTSCAVCPPGSLARRGLSYDQAQQNSSKKYPRTSATNTEHRTMSAICGIVGESAAGGRGRRDVSLMLDLLARAGRTAPSSTSSPRRPAGGVRRAAGSRSGRRASRSLGARRTTRPTSLVCDGEIFNARRCAAIRQAAPGAALRGDDDGELFAAPLRDGGRRAASAASTGSSPWRSGTAAADAGAGARHAGRARDLLPRHAGRRDVRVGDQGAAGRARRAGRDRRGRASRTT